MNYHAPDKNARFFVNFSPHGFLDRFGGFGEAGEGGEPVWWPALLSAEEEAVAFRVDDGHDDGGIRAREGEVGDALSGCAEGAVGVVFPGDVFWRAGAFEAPVYGEGGLAAAGAEGVAGVPVEELAGFGVCGGFIVRYISIAVRGPSTKDER